MAVRLTSEFPGDEPGLQAALLDWIVLSYVFSGLIAWWRRPDSRFGPLMIAAGFATSLSSLSSASGALPFTVGQAMDLVPFAVFFHVYLSFPTGPLRGRSRADGWSAPPTSWRSACSSWGSRSGASGRTTCSRVLDEPDLALTLFDVQLVTLAALALASIAVLAYRRRQAGPPLRRSAALLVDSFVVALAMITALLVMGTFFPGEAFLTVQRTTFFVIGLAPVAFLVALLDARLARSSVGDLLVELRADPAPAELREPIARALNDPSLELAYWLPQFGSWADSEGRRDQLPREGDGRATTLIDREGEHVAALVHDPSLERRARAARCRERRRRDRAGERSAPGGAQGAPRGAGGIAGPGDRGRPGGAKAPRAQPPRRRPTAADRAVARARAARQQDGRRSGGQGANRTGPRRDSHLARGASGRGARAPSGGAQRSRARRRARVARRHLRGAGRAEGGLRRLGWTSRSRSPPTTSSPRASPTSAKHAHADRARWRWAGRRPPGDRGDPTTGWAERTRSAARACAGWPTASRPSAGAAHLDPRRRRDARPAELPCG